MARNYKYKGTVTKDEIGEDLVPIEESLTDYITKSGRVFKLDNNGLYFEKAVYENKHNGYMYVGINVSNIEGKAYNKNRRQHVLLAKAFIPKIEGCDIVGHKDNNKKNNSLENLYWTTVKENTQKAVDDGLMINDIGIQDSQSNPIGVYNLDGVLVAVYGSIREAARYIEGVNTPSSIAKVLDNGATKAVKGYLYRTISVDFYEENKELQFKTLKTKYIQKVKTNIKVVDPENNVYIIGSQKEAGLRIGIAQATISRLLVTGKDYFGWRFYRTDDDVTEEKNNNIVEQVFPDSFNIPSVGDIFSSNNYGDFEIIRYSSTKDVRIKFIDTGYEKDTNMQLVRLGKIADKIKQGVA